MADLGAAVDRPTSTGRVWRVLVGAQLRSQLSYRSSFALATVTAFLTGALEFVEIYLLLHNTPQLGGLDFAQASLVFALSNLGFSFGDLIFGQLDRVPGHVRQGTLDTYLVRPMPLMAQLITANVQLRRLGRTVVGLIILIAALTWLRPDLDAARIVLLMITPLVGGAIFGALFAAAGGLQFFLVDGEQFTNAFVYGGSYSGQLPGSALMTPVRVFFTFVVPSTATGYLPAVVIMRLPGAALLPAWLGWCGPLFAIWAWLLATLCWRVGVRHYTGAGG